MNDDVGGEPGGRRDGDIVRKEEDDLLLVERARNRLCRVQRLLRVEVDDSCRLSVAVGDVDHGVGRAEVWADGGTGRDDDDGDERVRPEQPPDGAPEGCVGELFGKAKALP